MRTSDPVAHERGFCAALLYNRLPSSDHGVSVTCPCSIGMKNEVQRCGDERHRSEKRPFECTRVDRGKACVEMDVPVRPKTCSLERPRIKVAQTRWRPGGVWRVVMDDSAHFRGAWRDEQRVGMECRLLRSTGTLLVEGDKGGALIESSKMKTPL